MPEKTDLIKKNSQFNFIPNIKNDQDFVYSFCVCAKWSGAKTITSNIYIYIYIYIYICM